MQQRRERTTWFSCLYDRAQQQPRPAPTDGGDLGAGPAEDEVRVLGLGPPWSFLWGKSVLSKPQFPHL